jgi:uncharacterized membrane-anchored protein
LLSQARHYGGVGLGTIHTSLAFLTVIVALVAWVTFEVTAPKASIRPSDF